MNALIHGFCLPSNRATKKGFSWAYLELPFRGKLHKGILGLRCKDNHSFKSSGFAFQHATPFLAFSMWKNFIPKSLARILSIFPYVAFTSSVSYIQLQRLIPLNGPTRPSFPFSLKRSFSAMHILMRCILSMFTDLI
jgi:hypothetical protein